MQRGWDGGFGGTGIPALPRPLPGNGLTVPHRCGLAAFWILGIGFRSTEL